MMKAYCTLFDHTYMSRGLALYESLFQFEKEAVLYILAMDDICYHKLMDLQLKNVTIVCTDQFESKLLRQLKRERSHAEYCWTCTSFLIEYILNEYNVPICTYLDSDIFFFQSPEIVFSEMEGESVLITPHNFAEYCNLEKLSGKYCVQFLPFLNDEKGRRVLRDWKNKCTACCELAPEKGHCGDQKYLDRWMSDFDGVCEAKGLGIGVAPWNVERFSIYLKYGKLFVYEKKLKMEQPLVFYHFHGLRFFEPDIVRLADALYHLGDDAVNNIYVEYIRKIDEVHRKYDLEENINYDGIKQDYNLNLDSLGKNEYKRGLLSKAAKGVL